MTLPQFSLDIKRVFQAPRERVYQAWMRPEDLQQWWHMSADATTPFAEVDLRVGGRYRLGMTPPGSDELFVVTGTFIEIVPPERLVYTWSWENVEEEPESTVTVEFRDLGDATEVVINHGRFQSEERRQSHIDGWHGLMKQLDGIL